MNKVFDFKDEIKDTIQACFYADLSPLSVSQFTITSSTEFDYKLSETIVYNEHNNSEPAPSDIEITSYYIKLVFNGTDGMLRKIYRKQGGLFFALMMFDFSLCPTVPEKVQTQKKAEHTFFFQIVMKHSRCCTQSL